MTDLEKIEARMANGTPFTFADLHMMGGLSDPGAAYRLADRTIQKWRRKGLIKCERQGRISLWTLVKEGPK